MKRWTLTWLTLMVSLVALAQRTAVSGTIRDAKSGDRLAQVSVMASGSGEAVVTNEDGVFTLKTEKDVQTLVVSYVGYRTLRVNVKNQGGKPLDIRLTPVSVQLHEVVVWTSDPRQLVRIAMDKIPENYSRKPELMECFYRETAMKRQNYIYVAEGVVDMYKSAYTKGTWRDRVAIRKGRRLLSPRQKDTLSVKVMGGPVQPVQLDVVKNPDFLLNPEELENYSFELLPSQMIDDREQFVVAIAPLIPQPYALYHGRLYIDRETMAFTRVELELDMNDRDKATNYMLVKKPIGVRFRPRELSLLIDYKQDDGVTRISYVRNTFRFNCDWKRRLFATSFTAVCEMVVTDRAEEAHPIDGRQSFDSRDAFYDKVDYFRDPDFWRDYNIIEPSESLDRAITRLVKRNTQH